MDDRFEQQGRRPIVGIAVVLGFGMAALGFAYGAPRSFTAITTLSALMALAIVVQNSRSGLRLEGDTLTLFKDRWRDVIDVGTIRHVRVTASMDGQSSIGLDVDHAPPYRRPGDCFGSAEPLKDAFRQRGIAVAQEGMDIGNTVILLLFFVISGLLVLTPPIAVWRALSRQASGLAAWLYPALALIGPFIAAFVVVVLMSLVAYSGPCRDWLGETRPCSGFGAYATGTMFWTAVIIGMPGLLGMLPGVAVLLVV
ncbi:MAG: hypothetical protein NT037_17655 [Hyphomicrobiales bacterium]|nr:hypothetical protein [Hyphomicrobiales bacterium]